MTRQQTHNASRPGDAATREGEDSAGGARRPEVGRPRNRPSRPDVEFASGRSTPSTSLVRSLPGPATGSAHGSVEARHVPQQDRARDRAWREPGPAGRRADLKCQGCGQGFNKQPKIEFGSALGEAARWTRRGSVTHRRMRVAPRHHGGCHPARSRDSDSDPNVNGPKAGPHGASNPRAWDDGDFFLLFRLFPTFP